MPVTPTMSAAAQRAKSIGSTFSSISVMRCSGGVSAASSGKAATGSAARLPMNGKRVLEAPERHLEARIDEHDVHRVGPPG